MVAITSPLISECGLCGNQAELRDSHIIPAFVARWIKDTSATALLRSFHQPNRRVQDFETKRLLCEECEHRFSVAEEKFARLVFYPYHDGRVRFPYEDWLLYFAVSLAWRCSVTSGRAELLKYPHHVEAIESARYVWADFLLARSDRVGRYRFNVFFTGYGASGASDVSKPSPGRSLAALRPYRHRHGPPCRGWACPRVARHRGGASGASRSRSPAPADQGACVSSSACCLTRGSDVLIEPHEAISTRTNLALSPAK